MLQFWVESEKSYPLLSSIAVDTLAIPGLYTPVEWVFSAAGQSTSGKRNSLANKNLYLVLKLLTPMTPQWVSYCLVTDHWLQFHSKPVKS